MFYDYTLSKMVETITVDEIGQEIKTYNEGTSFIGDIQPITGNTKQSMGWGDDVVGTLTLYTDESLSIGEIVSYNGTYEIEKSMQWDYFIYSLKKVDL